MSSKCLPSSQVKGRHKQKWLFRLSALAWLVKWKHFVSHSIYTFLIIFIVDHHGHISLVSVCNNNLVVGTRSQKR